MNYVEILDGVEAATVLHRKLKPGRQRIRPTYLFNQLQQSMGGVPASLMERLRNSNGEEVHATPEEVAALRASRGNIG